MSDLIRVETGRGSFAEATGTAAGRHARRVLASVEHYRTNYRVLSWAGNQPEIILAVNSPSPRRQPGAWYHLVGDDVDSNVEISILYPATFDSDAVGRLAGHEVGHAVLDSIKRSLSHFAPKANIFKNQYSFEVAAFHEAFADSLIMLADLLDKETVEREIDSAGNILPDGILDTFGGECGVYEKAVLEHPRKKSARHTYTQFKDSSGVISGANCTEHAASQVVSGFIFDMVAGMVKGYMEGHPEAKSNPGEVKLKAARYVSAYVGSLLIRAAVESPSCPDFFSTFGAHFQSLAAEDRRSPFGGVRWKEDLGLDVAKLLKARGLEVELTDWQVPNGRNRLLRHWDAVSEEMPPSIEMKFAKEKDLPLDLESLNLHKLEGMDTPIEWPLLRQMDYKERLILDSTIHPSLDKVAIDIAGSTDLLDLEINGSHKYYLPSNESCKGGVIDKKKLRSIHLAYIKSLVDRNCIDFREGNSSTPSGPNAFTFVVDKTKSPELIHRTGFFDM